MKIKYLIFFLSLNILAQENDKVTIGDIISLKSEILNEDRTLQVYLPESYNGSTFNYPVLYLLDSEYEFHQTTGTVNFLSGVGKIPEMIVVGIVNTNRSRDLTPEAPNDKDSKAFWGEIGGAENFRTFFQKELIPFIDKKYIPFIDKKYRTSPYKIIRGQSFGGLFGLFDFFDTPLFNAYIITSPTVRWNNNELFKKLNRYTYNKGVKTKIYIGEAEFDSGDDTGIEEFSRLLKSKIKDSIFFKYAFFKGEGHYSLVYNATQNGLKFIYKNWELPNKNAISANLETLKDHFAKLSNEFGYKINIPMNDIIRLTNTKLREQNYSAAIKIAKINIEYYPNQPETYWHTGDAYTFAGDYKNALKYFELALQKALAIGVTDLSEHKNSIQETKMKIK